MDIEGLKLKEVALFLDLVKTKSIRELARQRHVTPGQISKGIRSLEVRLGKTLLQRSAQGVVLTPAAREVLPYFEGIRNFQERLLGHVKSSEEQAVLSIATSSFFSSHFVPGILGEFERAVPDIRCRVIDLPPNQFVPVALRNGFEVCIHLGDLDWPKTWTSIEIGRIQWHLCCRKGHPVSSRPSLKNILRYPFVSPVYWTQEGLRQGEDLFPIPMRNRRKGYETATAASAAQIVAQTDQLSFIPDLVAHPMLKEGRIQTLRLPSKKNTAQTVYLTVKADAIKQKRFMWFKEVCQRRLGQTSVVSLSPKKA